MFTRHTAAEWADILEDAYRADPSQFITNYYANLTADGQRGVCALVYRPLAAHTTTEEENP
jgi:hypothetical protein